MAVSISKLNIPDIFLFKQASLLRRFHNIRNSVRGKTITFVDSFLKEKYLHRIDLINASLLRRNVNKLNYPAGDSTFITPSVFTKISNCVSEKSPLICDDVLTKNDCNAIINYFETHDNIQRTYQGKIDLDFRNALMVELSDRFYGLFDSFITKEMKNYFGISFNTTYKFIPKIYKYPSGSKGFGIHHDLVTTVEKEAGGVIIGGDYTVLIFLNTLEKDQEGEFVFLDYNKLEEKHKENPKNKFNFKDFERQTIQSIAGRAVAFRVDDFHWVNEIKYSNRYSLVLRLFISE